MFNRQVRCGSLYVLVVVFVVAFVQMAGCAKESKFDLAIKNARSVYEIYDAYGLAQNDEQQFTALTKLSEMINGYEEVSNFNRKIDTLYSSEKYRDRVLTLRRHTIENNPHFSTCWNAFRSLPDSLQEHYLPHLVHMANNFSDAQMIYGWASLQRLQRIDVMSQVVDIMIRANPSNVGRAWLMDHLLLGSAAWIQNVNEMLDGQWWMGFCDAYNVASTAERRCLEDVVQHRKNVDWSQIYQLTDHKLPLHQYALAQLLGDRPLPDMLADYKAADDPELRQQLAGRIDKRCQSRGDTSDDWECVLVNSDPNTPLNIMAQRRLWDINARPVGQTEASPNQPEPSLGDQLGKVIHWTGLAPNRPTTANGITLEWQTLRPIYRYTVRDTTSSCPPAPWGVIRAVYRAVPWGEIKPIYRTAPVPAPQPAPWWYHGSVKNLFR